MNDKRLLMRYNSNNQMQMEVLVQVLNVNTSETHLVHKVTPKKLFIG